MMNFKDKVVMVAGAASGIGLLTSQTFAQAGAKVVLADVNHEAVSVTAGEICANDGEAIGAELDIRDYNQVKAAIDLTVEKYGKVDILVNSAGGDAGRIFKCSEPFYKRDISIIDWCLDVNLKGVVYCCHAVLGKMIKQQSGVIINISSVAGMIGAQSIDYSTAKSGIIGLTKSLAMCGAPHGVRACCVTPGPVLTRPEMANMKTPLGRAAEPEEITELILYLCSTKGAFITGSNYIIDGGFCCCN